MTEEARYEVRLIVTFEVKAFDGYAAFLKAVNAVSINKTDVTLLRLEKL